MQIFYLDEDQNKIVEHHVDRHVVKMPVECTQMLCTTLREDLGIDFGYKSVFVNHPCRRWAGANRNNFRWLLSLGLKLCDEYEHRYGKVHATKEVLLEIQENMHRFEHALADEPFQEPPKVVSEEFKHLSTVEAYREYYRHVKTRLHKWSNRPTPPWIEE